MSNEIDISNPGSLQDEGHGVAWRLLRLILAQAVADSSSAVALQQTEDGAMVRYETQGYWYQMTPPPPELIGPLLRTLKEKAGLSPDADWGEGEILLRTEEAPISVELTACTDPQGRSLVMLCRVPMRDSFVPEPTVVNAKGRMDMYERFTDRSRKVMALANQEAQRFNHEYIGTEHILLGLIKEGSGVGATTLKSLGVDIKMLRQEVEKLVRSGPDRVTYGKLPQTPRAKRVIEFAIEEARALRHRYVGTEHLLLGLIREHDGIAAQVLKNLGLRLETVRQEILNLLGDGEAVRPTRTMGLLAAGDVANPTRAIGLPFFVNAVKTVMGVARREAISRNLEGIHIEHVLLALIKTDDQAAQRIFTSLNIDTGALQEKIESLPPKAQDTSSEGAAQQDSRTRDALRHAIQEAVALHHPYVGVQHLLLGVVAASASPTREILTECGLTPEAVRQEMVRRRTEVAEEAVDRVLRQELPAELLEHIGLPADQASAKVEALASRVYKVAGTLPKKEAHDLASQMRRCALSIPPHLAEARRRSNSVESRWFLNIAVSALTEVQYLLHFATGLGYIDETQYSELSKLTVEVEMQLRALSKPLS